VAGLTVQIADFRTVGLVPDLKILKLKVPNFKLVLPDLKTEVPVNLTTAYCA